MEATRPPMPAPTMPTCKDLPVLHCDAEAGDGSQYKSSSIFRDVAMFANIYRVNSNMPVQIIKSVVPLYVGQFMFVRIETDQGIVGYGEAGNWGHIAAAQRPSKA
ncbi:2- oxo-3-deoxygalactonate 6-phosphate aldolase [Fusarium agapanthi]|uniref:2- oxo-3-deoxygalactonate 6-phosphate aldolase n=1 Tax=Fusarium agapanthi TaxID=1803897 RepID=A0A9P5EGR8_9HYPO|nr:2- oxo-3-deoxygalactonate 6-phosphate aldolase [Fusarium agapanthi]